jgi:hypothetical protein
MTTIATSSLERPNPIKQPLMTVRIIGRVLFLNGDPGLNYLLPLSNGWEINDLAREILRAAAGYDLMIAWHSAKFLASKLLKQIMKDERQFNGGFELGWD